MNDLSTSLYFFHIPRTAGTSLSTFLETNYQQEKWLKAYEIEQLLTFSREEVNSYQCFHGHFGTLLFSLVNKPLTNITMIRDPLAQFISVVYFSKKWLSQYHQFYDYLSDEELKLKIIFQNSSLEEIVENSIFNMYLSNLQSRYLGCELKLEIINSAPLKLPEVLTKEEQDMDKIVVKAKERLDQMAIVGITERFNDSCDLICDFLNIKPPKIYPRLNVSSKEDNIINYKYISPELANKIREINKYDMEVYEYGKRIFEEKMKIFQEKKVNNSRFFPRWISQLFQHQKL